MTRGMSAPAARRSLSLRYSAAAFSAAPHLPRTAAVVKQPQWSNPALRYSAAAFSAAPHLPPVPPRGNLRRLDG